MWRTVHSRYYDIRYEVPIIVAEADKVAVSLRAFLRKSRNDRELLDIADHELRDELAGIEGLASAPVFGVDRKQRHSPPRGRAPGPRLSEHYALLKMARSTTPASKNWPIDWALGRDI